MRLARLQPSRSGVAILLLAWIGGTVGILGASAAVPGVIVVNSLLDVADPNDGLCTLHEALVSVNTNAVSGPAADECAAGQAAPAQDSVVFSVAGTIHVGSMLPQVAEPVLLSAVDPNDPNAPCPSFLPVPRIELDGTNTGSGNIDGLHLNGGNSIVRGLAINRFGGTGIYMEVAGGNRIQCNLIGTDPDGLVDEGNGARGVSIGGGANSFIGTDADGASDQNEGNLISGNGLEGVYIYSSGGNRVSGNFIGTDRTGTVAIGSVGGGMVIEGASLGNVIGTDGDGVSDGAEGNLISGNGAGVEIRG